MSISSAATKTEVKTPPTDAVHTPSFAETAASADPEDVKLAAEMGPLLSEMIKAEAAVIESEAMRAHHGTVERGSFASKAQAAAVANERAEAALAAAAFTSIIPAATGGDQAAARADQFQAVYTALKGSQYDLEVITWPDLQHLESVASKANHGIIESDSYVARAQSAVDYRQRWHKLPHARIVPEIAGGDAALGKATAISAVLPFVPPLDAVSTAHAERIYAAAAQEGDVEQGSYAQQAVAAAHMRAHAHTEQQHEQQHEQQQQFGHGRIVIPEAIGGQAAAARAAALSSVLQFAPPLDVITGRQARQIESEAMRAAGG
jgi:hypothetical protein